MEKSFKKDGKSAVGRLHLDPKRTPNTSTHRIYVSWKSGCMHLSCRNSQDSIAFVQLDIFVLLALCKTSLPYIFWRRVVWSTLILFFFTPSINNRPISVNPMVVPLTHSQFFWRIISGWTWTNNVGVRFLLDSNELEESLCNALTFLIHFISVSHSENIDVPLRDRCRKCTVLQM